MCRVQGNPVTVSSLARGLTLTMISTDASRPGEGRGTSSSRSRRPESSSTDVPAHYQAIFTFTDELRCPEGVSSLAETLVQNATASGKPKS